MISKVLRLYIILFFVLFTCSKDEQVINDDSNDTSDNTDDSENSDSNSGLDVADWSANTHSNDIDPNYTEVYEDNGSVRRLDIVFDPSDWALMLEDMSGLFGTFGQGGGGPGGGGPGGGFPDENPIFRPAEVY